MCKVYSKRFEYMKSNFQDSDAFSGPVNLHEFLAVFSLSDLAML